ncbi:hypothetical protein MBLNU459_g1274t1 [Dothideomycetes sp. NU459]
MIKVTSSILALLATTFGPVHAIIGGTNVRSDSYDYTVAIFQPALDESSTTFICDGVLITSSTVLTVAECVQYLEPFNVLVRSGTNTADYQNLTVSSIVTHPQYDPDTLAYDLALVHLDSAVIGIVPADIPNSNSTLPSQVGIVGWGATTNATAAVANRLNEAEVAIIDSNTCVSQLSSCYTLDPTQHFCTVAAGPGEGYGDSGGPVVDDNGCLVGLISGNPGCAQPKSIAIEVNVGNFHDWIVENAF